jgi:predicted TIM-barrel fold metal-dependent hydrolase
MASADPVVDVHHHYMPPAVFERLAAQAGGRRIVTREISLTLSPARRDLEAHLRVMDEAGVRTAILTDQVQVLGEEVCRMLNDGIARAAREHPERFVAAVHLPVHEPRAAERELARGIEELGARAVAMLASHLDVQLDDPIMHPLFARVQRERLPIIVHPQSRPSGSATAYNLDRCVFRPLETTQAIVRVISGVLPRFPELEFVMPHLGGAVSSLKGRMMAFFEPEDVDVPADLKGYLKTQSEQRRLGLAERFDRLFGRLYFDTAGTGAWRPAFAAAFQIISGDRIMFGSDYPLECKSAANLLESMEAVREACRSAEERRAILGGTAAALFRLAGA